MEWLSLLAAFAKLGLILAQYLERRGILQQGEAEAIGKANARVVLSVENAKRIRTGLAARPITESDLDSVRRKPRGADNHQ